MRLLLFLIITLITSVNAGRASWQRSSSSGGSSSCSVTVQNGVLTQQIDATQYVTANESLSVSIITTFHSSFQDKGAGGHSIVNSIGRFILGTDVLLSYNTTSAIKDHTAQMNINEGSHQGIFSVNNDTISGSIDGVPFQTFQIGANGSTDIFQIANARLKPRLLQLTKLNATFQLLQDQVVTATKSCSDPHSGNFTISPDSGPMTTNSTSSAALLLHRRFDDAQDPGHLSNTQLSFDCWSCQAAVFSAAAAASVGCGFVCAATFGIGCGACVAAVLSTEWLALDGCFKSSLCCPQACGTFGGSQSPCCSNGETCLDSDTGRCCSQWQTACWYKNCCNTDQYCISLGEQQGMCCPTAPCGGFCCPNDTDVCRGDRCCPVELDCNTACCDGGVLGTGYCADWDKSLCCFGSQHEVDGICCNKGEKNCNGACCAGTCTSEGVCLLTADQCKARGQGAPCISDNDCSPKGYYRCLNNCCSVMPQ